MFGKKKKVVEEELAPHEMGPPVEFKARGGTNQENQANMIQVRQSMGIVTCKELFASSIANRADRVLLDFTRDAVAVRLDIDGVWRQMPALDRQSGDVMLACLKKLANLNPADRRSKQVGEFQASFREKQYISQFSSQGTQTGERVLMRLIDRGHKFQTMEELGMREKMQEHFKHLIGRITDDGQDPLTQGLFAFSAPPNGGGLSTLWSVGMRTTDRYMRDFVCFEEVTSQEDEIENVERISYDQAAGESPAKLLPKAMLKQPDVLCIPNVADKESLTAICDQVVNDHKMGFVSLRGRDAAEALLQLAQLTSPQRLAKSVTGVLNMRLCRRLCEKCKQAYQPNPQLLQKLGLPPERVTSLYREWQPPPPGTEPDKGKKNEEPEVCRACRGVGYRGRVGIFELMIINDAIREALTRSPSPDVLRQLSRQAGNRTLQEEGILLVVKGTTSLVELQRALKQA